MRVRIFGQQATLDLQAVLNDWLAAQTQADPGFRVVFVTQSESVGSRSDIDEIKSYTTVAVWYEGGEP